jgi:hypothetical protein
VAFSPSRFGHFYLGLEKRVAELWREESKMSALTNNRFNVFRGSSPSQRPKSWAAKIKIVWSRIFVWLKD